MRKINSVWPRDLKIHEHSSLLAFGGSPVIFLAIDWTG